jgi:hypothetical protein
MRSVLPAILIAVSIRFLSLDCLFAHASFGVCASTRLYGSREWRTTSPARVSQNRSTAPVWYVQFSLLRNIFRDSHVMYG